MPDQQNLSVTEKIGDAVGKTVIFVFFIAPVAFIGLYFTWKLYLQPLFVGHF